MTDSFITLLVGADNMPANDTHTDDWDASDWEVADFSDEGEDLSSLYRRFSFHRLNGDERSF